MNRFLSRVSLVATAFLVFAFSTEAKAQMIIPDCPALEGWVSVLPSSDPSKRRDASEIETLLSDENVIPVFGVSFLKWTQVEADLVRGLLVDCRDKADFRDDNKAKNRLDMASIQLERTQRQTRVAFKEPACPFVYQWVTRGVRLPSNMPKNVSEETRGRILFADSYIVPLFGLPYEDWRSENRSEAVKILFKCRRRMSSDSEKDVFIGIDMAIKHINRH